MIVRSENYISNPLVACSVIVYNQREYISQCLDGILCQECNFSFNIVVADDCSTDGTQDALLEYQTRYPDKIKLVLNEKNGHIAANWVSCCRALEGGEFVAFCDGDDYWSNANKLQLQVEYMRQHTECVALSTKYEKLYSDGFIEIEKKIPLTGWVQKDLLSQGLSVAHWSSFIMRKNVFDEHMPLDAFVEHHFPFQDWPAMVIMAAYGEFHYMPIVTTTYRVITNSDSHCLDLDKLIIRQEKCREMNNFLTSLIPNVQPDSDEVFDRCVALTMISACIRNGEYNKAKFYARKSCHKNLRYWCCQTRLSFELFRLAKLSRVQFNHLKRKLFVYRVSHR